MDFNNDITELVAGPYNECDVSEQDMIIWQVLIH